MRELLNGHVLKMEHKTNKQGSTNVRIQVSACTINTYSTRPTEVLLSTSSHDTLLRLARAARLAGTDNLMSSRVTGIPGTKNPTRRNRVSNREGAGVEVQPLGPVLCRRRRA